MLRLPIILTIASCALAAKLDVVHEWKYIDYLWNSEDQKNRAIDEKRYNYTVVHTIDVQYAPDGRIFVTTPKCHPQAIPASLSTVSDKNGPGGPLLEPYPNWDWHDSGDCNGLTSVWRVTIDDCGRLWVLDSGKIGDNLVCPAQLLIFDIKTNKLEKRLTIPNDVSQNSQNKSLGLLITPVVETEGINCEKTWVYIADVQGAGLVIYDGSKFWRIENDAFKLEPNLTEFSVAGQSIVIHDGLFGLAVTPEGSSSPRRLFFRPLASLKQYSFSTKDLHKSGDGNNDPSYILSDYRYPSQAAAQAFSQDGILFSGLFTQMAIACWNLHTPMDDEHVVIVAQDDETLQFAGGLKVTRRSGLRSKEELWVSTNRLQEVWTGSQNFEEINFRILRAPVDTLVEGTKCQLQRS